VSTDKPLRLHELPADAQARLRFSLLVEATIGFEMPEPTRKRLIEASGGFDYARRYRAVLSPKWSEERLKRSEGTLRDNWRQVFDGVTAAHYHRARVAAIEGQVEELVNANLDHFVPTDGTGRTTGFPCRPITSEYHAFLFAERRALDYLSVLLARFFDSNSSSIRRLHKAIAGKPPDELRRCLQLRLDRDLPAFGIVKGSHDSARDRLAHREAVDAGSVNVIASREEGARIIWVGGEEDLGLGRESHMRLSSALDERLARLNGFVFGCFEDLGLLIAPSQAS
jgi:hypothetical protein